MRRAGRLRVGQRFAVVALILGLVLAAGVIAGVHASRDLADARARLVLRIDPALVTALRLQTSYLDQETGVRGFVLAGDSRFLTPYARGLDDERAAAMRLQELFREDPKLNASSRLLDRTLQLAATWQQGFAEPAIQARRTKPKDDDVNVGAGRARFDRLRRSLAVLQAGLGAARGQARAALNRNADRLNQVLIAVAALLVLGGLMSILFIRQAITVPIAALADEVRRVADGDFEHGVNARGPADVVALAEDVDSMRARIVQELTVTRAVQQDLERSNAELEQFAYVASHDLQEPLRKVASFTQMLQRRYEGQLDEKADQYIFFAVDGAKRMQELINDLLAFSRVGRVTREHQAVPLRSVIDRALTDLAGAIEDTGAQVEVTGELPTLRVDAGLLALVFQNLIGNAVKFHGEDGSPHVSVEVARGEDGSCEIAVHDDGIGIEDEYADRIFIIFQRLHPKERYGGTGIGLAMCRKIIEYHGGAVWLDVDDPRPGTTFRLTLPSELEESPAP
ncbi:MAG: multi-sensor signal transduction histidine kinase [Solirubrobacterales bacterium]|nr:multi-sensor signal transduction histidine kinase [Solirubrobacterales bacterium]